MRHVKIHPSISSFGDRQRIICDNKNDLKNRVQGMPNALDRKTIWRASYIRILKHIEKYIIRNGEVYKHLIWPLNLFLRFMLL